MRKKKTEEHEFTITLSKGLASRRRLPLEHVIEVLREFQQMVRDIGRRLQREAGILRPDGDFGIQLLAKATGDVFRGGSITATGAMTRYVELGDTAIGEIITTANALEKKRPVSLDDQMRVRIVKGLSKIGEIQRQDQTEFSVSLKKPGQRKQAATIGESGIQTLQNIETEVVNVDGVTLYGKLFDLRDRSKTDDLGKYLWGELRTDTGEIWRVQFESRHARDVIALFTKQVKLSGDATYSKTRNPQLSATSFAEDQPKDYLAAFDELVGTDTDIYGKEEIEDLMQEARGEA